MPTFSERLSSLIAGAPLGSRPLTRTEPYEELLERRRSRSTALSRACAALVVLMVALATAMTAYAAQTGYWKQVENSNVVSAGYTSTYRFRWVASSGTTPDTITLNGREYDNTETVTKNSDGELRRTSAPTVAPDGWTIDTDRQQENKDANTGAQEIVDEATDSDDKKISDGDPNFSLSFDFVEKSIWKVLWQLCRGLVSLALSIAKWFLDLMGSNAEAAFTSDFSTGTFSSFYKVAKEVSTRAFQPYALAFLGLVFGLALMRPFDPRRRLHGVDQAAQVVMTVAMLCVSTTLILHAIDLCGAIYWLAQNLVHGLSTILDGLGISPSSGDFGDSMQRQFLDVMDSITYGEAASSFFVLLVAAAAMVVCIACSFSVMTTIFLRVGEIYLRASASPLCLAFLIDDHSKQVGVGYMKRFGAVCAQAAIIFLAVGMTPLFFEVAAAFVSPVLPDASGMGGTGTVLAATIPSLCAVWAVKGVVNKSEHIANSLFGLAG